MLKYIYLDKINFIEIIQCSKFPFTAPCLLAAQVIHVSLLHPAGVHPGQHHGLLHGAPLPCREQLDKPCSKGRGKERVEDGVDA